MSGEGVVKLDETITAENVSAKVHTMFSQAQSLVNIDANLALSYIRQITAASNKFKYDLGIGIAELLYGAYHWFHGDIESRWKLTKQHRNL